MKVLTDKQYQVLLDFFHEFNDEFWKLDQAILDAYFDRLYRK